MDPFYEMLIICVNHKRCCQDCGERLWLAYSDGHIWDECLNCDEPTKYADKYNLDIAGYVTTYPIPTGALPDCIEVSYQVKCLLPHECCYRQAILSVQ